MAETKKVNYIFDESIKYNTLNLDSPVDANKLPVYTIKNCEVGFNSLNQKRPPKGHSLQVFINDEEFVAQDKKLRDSFAKARAVKDVNVEFYKSSIVRINQADYLECKSKGKNYITEDMVGRANTFFGLTTRKLVDVASGKFIQDVDKATGEDVEVRYYATQDKFTGEPIKPEIFKINTTTGEKEYTFNNPKTKLSTPHYLNQGDLVDINVRIFESFDSIKNIWSLKYNPVSIEIVKTKFEAGGGSESTYKAESADLDVLSSVFGITETVDSSKANKAKSSKVAQKETKEEDVLPKTEKVKEEKVVETSDVEFPSVDDLSLDSLGINLGD